MRQAGRMRYGPWRAGLLVLRAAGRDALAGGPPRPALLLPHVPRETDPRANGQPRPRRGPEPRATPSLSASLHARRGAASALGEHTEMLRDRSIAQHWCSGVSLHRPRKKGGASTGELRRLPVSARSAGGGTGRLSPSGGRDRWFGEVRSKSAPAMFPRAQPTPPFCCSAPSRPATLRNKLATLRPR